MTFFAWTTQRRLLLTTAIFFSLVGAVAWRVMPRQEDPRLPDRIGLVLTSYPGADAEQVERLVLEPIEEELAEVEEIKKVQSTARASVAIVNIELSDSVSEPGEVWDEVQRALDRARREFPQGVSEPELDRELIDTESVVLVLQGGQDRLELADAAKHLKHRLLSLPGVSKVVTTGEPEEQITITYDDPVARRLGLDARMLVQQLSLRNTALPGGSVRFGERRATLRPNSDFGGIDELRRTPVTTEFGTTLTLEDIADVRRTTSDPAVRLMRNNGHPAIALGVVASRGSNLVDFGERLRSRVNSLRGEFAPFEISELAFQPDRVAARLDGLSRSLMFGILIVALLLVVAMGPRLGLLVASVIPLVALTSLGIFAMGGGILHQISVAALVLALGMLVDNAIVVAESVQRRIDQGVPGREAAVESIRELFVPLAAATGTTIAAFLPMLMSRGPTADFTRSIPVVLMLSLSVSYVFAIAITPVLAAMLLRRRARATSGSALERLAQRLGSFAVRRRTPILFVALSLVVVSSLAAGHVEQQFFPDADRNQLVISLEMPEGSDIEAVNGRSLEIERALSARPEVSGVAAFVGQATPRFYYNLLRRPNSPHLAQLLITTRSTESVQRLADWTRAYVGRRYPELEIVARPLEQGPPVTAPIEVRIHADKLESLTTATQAVLAEVRSIHGTRDVRHTLGSGGPSLNVVVDDFAASRRAVTRGDVALALLGRTRGLELGQLRSGSDPVPIVVRSVGSVGAPVNALGSIDVAVPGRTPVQLADVAESRIEWQPAVIQHHQRRRTASVLAELAHQVPYSRVLAELDPRLKALRLPSDVELGFGGAEEGADRANMALLSTLPIGLFLLVFILLAEFNSFRRLAMVLVTVPLAATGVVPGLVLSGQPFGFMSMLGVFALVGIVVNNAIVLLDVTERRRAEGANIEQAVSEAVRVRTRPILLTTLTTVAGLLPLALSNTTLWPPLAWAMVSGLLASTALTLLVVPALYTLLYRERATTSEVPV